MLLNLDIMSHQNNCLLWPVGQLCWLWSLVNGG